MSFEVDVPTAAEFESRIARTLERLPWLVCAEGDAVLGYAYAAPHQERAAFQWSVNVSVYVREGHGREGIGRALYTSLFACLRAMGYYNAYAAIALPNPASVGLHEAMGFQHIGTFPDVGHKLGRVARPRLVGPRAPAALAAKRPRPAGGGGGDGGVGRGGGDRGAFAGIVT